MLRPFTVWIDCSSDLKMFENFRPSASNFKSFSRSLQQFFLTVRQNNFGNKIPFFWFFLKKYSNRYGPGCDGGRDFGGHEFLTWKGNLQSFEYWKFCDTSSHTWQLHIGAGEFINLQSNLHFSAISWAGFSNMYPIFLAYTFKLIIYQIGIFLNI